MRVREEERNDQEKNETSLPGSGCPYACDGSERGERDGVFYHLRVRFRRGILKPEQYGYDTGGAGDRLDQACDDPEYWRCGLLCPCPGIRGRKPIRTD